MNDIVQLSQKEFSQWLRGQLEKREFMGGQRFCREKLKEELYEILFYEQGITVEEIEQFFIPFGQAGYLTPKRKFEIMLYILEKDYGSTFLFMNGIENCCVITEEDVEAVYLQWLIEERIFLSEEEKKEFFVQSLLDNLGLGVLEVLKRIAPDGFLVGEFCPALYEQEHMEQRIGICTEGVVIHLPFLRMESEEELIRIIKYAVAIENKRELTMIEPMLDFVQEDGTCMTAVRPPAGKGWGIRVLYGAARKGGMGWRKP